MNIFQPVCTQTLARTRTRSPTTSSDTNTSARSRTNYIPFMTHFLTQITAELATALPQNGGYVIWVSCAFGETAGFVEGILKFFAGLLDNCVYPVMMVSVRACVRPCAHARVFTEFHTHTHTHKLMCTYAHTHTHTHTHTRARASSSSSPAHARSSTSTGH